MNDFLWGVYPYLCIVLFFVVPILRMMTRPFSWSTRASGLFGKRILGIASVFMHWGLALVLLGHIVALIGGVLGSEAAVAFFYWIGLIGGLLVLIGSVMALIRRYTSAQVRAMSQSDDYIVHYFLIALVSIALYQVLIHRIFGISYSASSWAASLWTFSPQPELMASASLLTKLHILLALTFFAYFPFTKLVHFWTFPINYFVRPNISMRTQRYRFVRQWEFAFKSDKTWLVYGLGTVAIMFLISAALLGKAQPPANAGLLPVAGKSSQGLMGYPLYVSQCARCHGNTGRGDGPGAQSPTFVSFPRDFVYRNDQEHQGARYRFVTTDNGIASDDDLYRSITEGLTGSGMPAFPDLSEDQIWSLVDILNQFRADSPDPGNPIIVGPAPPATPQTIARGKELFLESCVSCHGEDGRGGKQEIYSWRAIDADSFQQVKAADLAAGHVKLGTSPQDIYQRITIGIPGAWGNPDARLMLSFKTLSESDRWALVDYVINNILPAAANAP